jgi:hypothetical protein
MARRPTGTIVEHVGKDGLTYRSLKFRAYAKRRYQSLGTVGRDEAEQTLRGILADVERGIWKEREPLPPEPEAMPTFHELVELWWVEREHELRRSTQTDYRWRLEAHLLPFFGEMPLDRITPAEVDHYKAMKLKEADDLRRRIAAGEKVCHEKGSVADHAPRAPSTRRLCCFRRSWMWRRSAIPRRSSATLHGAAGGV